MRRVFFFSGYRLKLFYWQQSRLQGSLSFEPNDEGFAQFETYLAATCQEPAAFLVDLIEEDYFHKKIAHCTGASRQALLKRALTQQFRDAKYTFAQFQGTVKEKNEKTGRHKKQDVFLLSALTNPAIMDPWLDRIRAAGIAISGIYSVAHLMSKIFNTLHAKRKYVLLITQEVGTAFRQSFFDDGKLVFSRQAKIPRGTCDSGDSLAYACVLTSEIEQTVEYVETQRRVNTDDLEVHCLVPTAHHAVLAKAFKSANERALFVTHDLGKFCPNKYLSHTLADSLLAWYCARLPVREKHYSMAQDDARFKTYLQTQGLTWGAAMVLVGATVTSLVFGFQTHQATEAAERLARQVRALEGVYEREFGVLGPQLSLAEQVRDTVNLAKVVKTNTHLTPQDFFIQLSGILSAPEFSAVALKEINWRKGLGAEVHFEDLIALKVAKDPNFDPNMAEEMGLDDGAAEAEVNIGVISGTFNMTAQSSYSRVVSLANTFIAAIEAHERVQRVDVLTLPIEHRFHKEFRDEVSQDMAREGKQSIDGRFKFRIIMRGPMSV